MYEQGCSLRPMASIALVDGSAVGSSQHSSFAHGFVLTTSGGSTPIFKQMNKPALDVFNRDFNRHGTAISLSFSSLLTFELSPYRNPHHFDLSLSYLGLSSPSNAEAQHSHLQPHPPHWVCLEYPLAHISRQDRRGRRRGVER